MARRVTHSLDDEFESRTLFLWATLGLVSYLRRFARGVASERSEGVRQARRGGDEALHAMLGLVSASRTARAHWRTLAVGGEPAPRRRRDRRARGLEQPRALLV